ncbi:MAG: hypothetical protein ACKO2P_04780 [Planctomycetota bacterium]
MSASTDLLRELIHDTAPLREYLRQPANRLLYPTRTVSGGFPDVIAIAATAHCRSGILVSAIATARTASARLLVLVAPAQDGTSQLEAVRAELQCHDIRTLPAGIRCAELSWPLDESLAEFLRQAPDSLVLLTCESAALAAAATARLTEANQTATAEHASDFVPQLQDFVPDANVL